MAWKQPIPTGLESIFGEDYQSMGLYKELIYRAANSEGVFTDKRGKSTTFKRGQVVFGREQFRKYLSWTSDRTVSRYLEKLEKVYKLVTKQADTNFTLVELLNYDELVSFDQAIDQAVTKQRPSSDQAVTTSKSVKSVKSVESEKKYTTAIAVVPVSPGYAKWEDEFELSLGFRITKDPKKNETALKGLVDTHGAQAVHAALGYLNWLKREKKSRDRPHWFQYVTSFLKVRDFWDHIQAGISDSTDHDLLRKAEMDQFYNR